MACRSFIIGYLLCMMHKCSYYYANVDDDDGVACIKIHALEVDIHYFVETIRRIILAASTHTEII